MPDEIKSEVKKQEKKEQQKEIVLSPEISKYLDEWTANPKSKIFVKLAEEYRKCGLIEEALHVCEKGLNENPGYLSGNMVLAKILFDMGDYDKSLEETLKVTAVQSDNIMAQNLLFELYVKKGDKDNAIKICDVISFLDPQNEGILNKKHEIETKGIVKEEPKKEKDFKAEDVQTAHAEEFDKELKVTAKEKIAVMDEEDVDFTTNTVAELYIKQGFYEKGLNIYKELLAESPDETKLIQRVTEIEDMIASKKEEEDKEEEKVAKVIEAETRERKEKEETVYEIEEISDIERGELIQEETPFVLDIDEENTTMASKDDNADKKEDELKIEEQKELSENEKKIEKLSGWLGKIQSRSGR